VWFALHVLFAEVDEVRLGPLRLWVPELMTFDPAAGLITAAAAVALLGFHAGLIVTLLGAAAAGMALTLFF
jgi:chromate transporter